MTHVSFVNNSLQKLMGTWKVEYRDKVVALTRRPRALLILLVSSQSVLRPSQSGSFFCVFIIINTYYNKVNLRKNLDSELMQTGFDNYTSL